MTGMPLALNRTAKEPRPGVIMALMKLYEVREKRNIKDISFGAGLPDHDVPEEVHVTMGEAAKAKKAYYPKYDPRAKFFEETLKPRIAEFHEKTFGIKYQSEGIAAAAGSTPVLTCVAGITQEYGTKTLVFSPDYPVFKGSVESAGGSIDRTARLYTKLDAKDGKPKKDRWQIDYDSVRHALDNNRKNATLLYLNFPSNPTGYSPTKKEYTTLVEALLEDVKKRRSEGLPKMVILEDIAYSTMMHDGKEFFSINAIIEDMLKHTNDPKRKNLLKELEQSVVTAHSFSKAFAVAGHRVAYYASKNTKLIETIDARMRDWDLTPSMSGLAAMQGALDKGEVDKEAMKEYGLRLRYFEKYMNDIVKSWLTECNDWAHLGKRKFSQLVASNSPVQAKADAGFFSSTFFNFLKDQPVDAQTIATLKTQIKALPTPKLKKEFENIFEHNRINNALDASLWLLQNANILAIPIAQRTPDDTNIQLRFSVGGTNIATIKKGLDDMKAAFSKLPNSPLTRGIAIS